MSFSHLGPFDSGDQAYEEEYEEVQCIGRGNFGKNTWIKSHIMIIIRIKWHRLTTIFNLFYTKYIIKYLIFLLIHYIKL